MSSESEIKRKILQLISEEHSLVDDVPIRDDIDYNQILDLASQLSEHDKNNVRFSVDGNLVKRLGEQLVAKKTTALSELIKNGYDADSTTLEVFFENTSIPGGTITIVDNGNGMTKDELINGFMRISTSDKADNPVSPKYNRPRAGRKGIGRFSAQKIGDKLTIITRTSSNEPYKIININWNDYLPKKNLISIANSIEESDDDHGFEKGTKLIISNTKEAWDDKNLTTAYKYICGIIRVTPSRTGDGIIDPGFKTFFYSGSPSSWTLVKSDKSEFLSEADALIESEVDENGIIWISITGILVKDATDRFPLNTTFSKFLKSANFKFTAHYYAMAREGRNSHLQAYLRDNGGIKLYRNGFYVAPYGERYNDWLSLDESSRRRLILNPHANTNFIGEISISDFDGLQFEETSSREGLIENNGFEELRRTSYEIIKSAVMRISSARGRKVTASQSGYVSPDRTIEERLKDSYEHLKNIAQQVEYSPSEKYASEHLEVKEHNSTGQVNPATVLKDSLDGHHELIQEIIDEKNIYRVLASTGLAIAEFTHEVQLYLNNLILVSRQLKRSISDRPDAYNAADDMNSNIEMLVSYTDFFTETIRSNSHRVKSPLELRDVFKAFFDAMQPTIQRRGYSLTVSFEGDDFWTKPIHVSELSSILMNLFTNSSKAIARAGREKGLMLVKVATVDEQHIIRFEDNGDGIPKENWGKVFNALFTTDVSSTAYGTNFQQMRGMGLGLTITYDIITGIGGEVGIVEATNGFNTCVQVIIPKASDAEVPQNAY